MAEENNLLDRMKGRAAYIYNGGGIKSAELLEEGVKEIERLRGALTTVKVNLEKNPNTTPANIVEHITGELGR